MKKYIIYLCFIVSFSVFTQNKVGEEILVNIQTPHPYLGNNQNTEELVWAQEVSQTKAGYIAVHFNKIELSENDFLIIRDVSNTRFWKYSHTEIEKKKNSFWSIPIYDDKLIIEIFSKQSEGDYGYEIDKIAKGYTLELLQTRKTEAICGDDDSQNAICYSQDESEVYDKSRAVARLLINGTNACTGWLIGDEGHLMTNEHCINSQDAADNVTVEFMAEGGNCNTDCQFWGACPGTIVATNINLVRVNGPLDYALLDLNNNEAPETYGFLQLREAGAMLNERIYIPQHPRVWGKRIALMSDNPNDQNGFATVNSLTEPRCGENSGNDIGYFADTQGGSSGSPVLGYDDNLVIALHHCARCLNRGVPIEEIIADLGEDLPNNSINNCRQNRAITENVNPGQTDIQQASETITATNTIFNGGLASYDAGTRVRLQSGFKALLGSTFRAFIEGCSTTSAAMPTHNNVVNSHLDVETDTALLALNENVEAIQVYPNPFTDKITVAYGLQKPGSIKLSIYTILGKLVKQVVIEENRDPGRYESHIDTGALPSGMYLYQLQLGEQVKTGKLIKTE